MGDPPTEHAPDYPWIHQQFVRAWERATAPSSVLGSITAPVAAAVVAPADPLLAAPAASLVQAAPPPPAPAPTRVSAREAPLRQTKCPPSVRVVLRRLILQRRRLNSRGEGVAAKPPARTPSLRPHPRHRANCRKVKANTRRRGRRRPSSTSMCRPVPSPRGRASPSRRPPSGYCRRRQSLSRRRLVAAVLARRRPLARHAVHGRTAPASLSFRPRCTRAVREFRPRRWNAYVAPPSQLGSSSPY